MSKQQPTLFSFFTKTPKSKESSSSSPRNVSHPLTNGKKASSTIIIKGVEIKSLDLVWGKLEGYPWWPALVYEHPTDKVIQRGKEVHVQFFDDPPTRGWVKEAYVKAYGPPASCGLPTYRDPEWIKAKEEADQVVDLPIEERRALIVKMQPSDDEEEEDDSDFDSSFMKENKDNKENVEKSNSGKKKRSLNGHSPSEPKVKRRRIILMSDSEASEDEYKPEGNAEESEDDTASSGVDESNISDVHHETESECDSPFKKNPKKQKVESTPQNTKLKEHNISLGTPLSSKLQNGSSNSSPSRALSGSTMSKLSSFAHKDTGKSSGSKGDDSWPHTNLPWLKPENIKDKNRRSPTDPDYDPRTIHVPQDFLNKQTPAMRQWWELKSNHFDTVLFFKMGKFYELFHMDAILSIQELGLLMMKGETAHTGFPEISYGRYSSILIEKGLKVARVEQVETPEMMEQRCKKLVGRPSKFDKVVKRELCQISSLGTRIPSVMNGDAVDEATNHYLLSITERVCEGYGDARQIGVAFIDTSIGTFHVGQFEDDRHLSRLRTLIARYPPSQILLERGKLSLKTNKLLKAIVSSNLLEELAPEKEFWSCSKTLTYLNESNFLAVGDKKEWPLCLEKLVEEGDSLRLNAKEEFSLGVSSLGGLLWYLQLCKLDEDLVSRKKFEIYYPLDEPSSSPDTPPSSWELQKQMILDGATLRNLEVFENSADGSSEGTLFQTLNHCVTPFGKRLLRLWLCSPLCNPSTIDSRLDAIEDLRDHPEIVSTIKPLMKKLPDLEKLLSKIHSLGVKHSPSHPDTRAIFYEGKQYSQKKVADFLCAISGFEGVEKIIRSFEGISGELKSKLLKSCVLSQKDGGKFYPLGKVLKFFDNAFDSSLAKKEGKIIPSAGVDKEYDEAMIKIQNAKESLDKYLKEQCRVFGAKVTFWGNDKKRFQLEVPDNASKRADDDYELVSQKKGFKRYWTAFTKECLADIMAAEEEKENALQDIARRIFHQFDEHHKEWTAAIECVAVIDVLLSLTEFSCKVDSTRPVVKSLSSEEKPFICIREGKYPCSIKVFSGGDYIPNDILLGTGEADAHAPLVLVTGPNMGGKSTLMRQTALICLMAQLGSFVPAVECRLSVVDRIFTRLGAWDQIYQGESTFFVELAETASILQHATPHSLVIVDELGRGTATYDGTAIAHSVVDRLNMVGCRTLFSTHYHSLVEEFRNESNISLGHMACLVESKEDDAPSQETVTFLYKFIKGACPKSYGFNAARLADIPESVIRCASEKAKHFELVSKKKKMFRRIFSEETDDKHMWKVFLLSMFERYR